MPTTIRTNSADSTFADSVMTANKDKNFVKRYLNPKDNPVIDNKDGSYSTHKMFSYDGKVAPMIVQKPNGKLKEFKTYNKAISHAEKNNEFIDLKNDSIAQKFANNGYKKAKQ